MWRHLFILASRDVISLCFGFLWFHVFVLSFCGCFFSNLRFVAVKHGFFFDSILSVSIFLGKNTCSDFGDVLFSCFCSNVDVFLAV